jgi:methylamine dehydrogenase accessory protein MauD
MNENKVNSILLMLIGIDILLIVAIGGLFVRVNNLQRSLSGEMQPAQEGLDVSMKAPLFTLRDTTGTDISLSDFAGEKVLLVFSSVTCPYCAEMYPWLKKFSERHSDMKILMISNGSLDENRRLAEAQDFQFPVLIHEGSVAKDYRVPGTPFFYVIDADGIITAVGYASSLEQLEELVNNAQK